MTEKRLLLPPRAEPVPPQPQVDDIQSRVQERAHEWERKINAARRFLAACNDPDPIAIILAFIERHLFWNPDEFARSVREMAARIQMETLRAEIDQCCERMDRITSEAKGKTGPDAWKSDGRFWREMKKSQALEKKYEKAHQEWCREAGISL